MPEIIGQGTFVPVDYDFILNKMPQANGTYVKIYLYILAKAGEKIEYSEIAKALSVIESDVINALDYWQQQGVLTTDNNSIRFASSAGNAAPKSTSPTPPDTTAPVQGVQKSDYTKEQVSDAIIASAPLRDMMSVAEELLAKPLNPSDMESLYWFYDGLGFSPEAVLMLLEYCVSRGKPRLSYAEKVAVSWKDRGLVTPEEISKYLRDSERRQSSQNRIMDEMGIGQRPATAGEEQYFAKWLGDYTMSEDMILLAYEYCIMQTGKLSFPYMDKILERWKNADIRTVSAAKEEHENFRKANTKAAAPAKDGYGHTDLEQLLRGK